MTVDHITCQNASIILNRGWCKGHMHAVLKTVGYPMVHTGTYKPLEDVGRSQIGPGSHIMLDAVCSKSITGPPEPHVHCTGPG